MGVGVGDGLLLGVAVALLPVEVAVTLFAVEVAVVLFTGLVSGDAVPVPPCRAPLGSGVPMEAWFVLAWGMRACMFDGEILFTTT